MDLMDPAIVMVYLPKELIGTGERHGLSDGGPSRVPGFRHSSFAHEARGPSSRGRGRFPVA